MTSLSDVGKAIGTLICIEWGLRIVEFLDPFSFLAVSTKTGVIVSIRCEVLEQIKKDGSYCVYMTKPEEEYYIGIIPEKVGDNVVLIKSDLMKDGSSAYPYKWIADNLKAKLRIDVKDS
jgi:hypothetical protein